MCFLRKLENALHSERMDTGDVDAGSEGSPLQIRLPSFNKESEMARTSDWTFTDTWGHFFEDIQGAYSSNHGINLSSREK